MMTSKKLKTNERYGQAFLIGLVVAAVMFLPFVIYDRGYFFFFGDFNVQQIPFYKLAQEAVRTGDIYWNWFTDLGANFIGSYSFYLLGSPFFWLTLPFPTAWVPYLMAPLFCLKFGVISLTGYGYITRFVKNKDYALLGGILYAFSGFGIYNIFFNHFHEAIAFFPLLLISLEELMMNKRRGFFAVSVFICALSNYFFFAGQVMFVILYFIIRLSTGDYKLTVNKFLTIALESVLGVAMAAFLLVPAALAVIQNPRVDDFFTGWSALFYGNVQRYGAILQTFFFPPDLPSRPNFFPDGNVKWASVAGWLPLVSMCGVIAFMQRGRGHFVKRVLLLSLTFALVPILNSAFFLFNSSYYARWFYMPILFLSLATVIAFEDKEADILSGIRWTGFITAAIAVAIGLMPKKDGDKTILGLEEYPDRFWLYVGISMLCVVLMYFLFRFFKERKNFPRILLVTACIISFAYGATFIGLGKTHSYSTDYIINTALNARDNFKLPETKDQFWRADVYDGMDNQAMYWHLPNIQAFHSIVPASVMNFYESIGIERQVASRPETSNYGLRPLVSVRWLFVNKDGNRDFGMPGYNYYDTQYGYEIYENTNYIPMGFAYDSYVDQVQFNNAPESRRTNLMVHSIYLDWETADRNADILTHEEDSNISELNEEQLADDCKARTSQSCYYFKPDNYGFTAAINLPSEKLVFFSVPYDSGFVATVNGKPARIEKANVGFMAVRVPAGSSTIRFEYFTPGLYEGIYVSLGALLIFLVYMGIWLLWLRKHPRQLPPEELPESSEPQQLSLYIDDEMPTLAVDPLAESEPATFTADTAAPGQPKPRQLGAYVSRAALSKPLPPQAQAAVQPQAPPQAEAAPEPALHEPASVIQEPAAAPTVQPNAAPVQAVFEAPAEPKAVSATANTAVSPTPATPAPAAPAPASFVPKSGFVPSFNPAPERQFNASFVRPRPASPTPAPTPAAEPPKNAEAPAAAPTVPQNDSASPMQRITPEQFKTMLYADDRFIVDPTKPEEK
ncbi:YfhO family protein [Acetanaerobacterium elongatum]|uniref:Uncharacterized membrane protein YfhO n=1 Tax=Acetanaerobacterium elongatum TaxID=258515 RepID=A0A1G9UH75_9FIRM|nr:YfhO family protein [Acetanaerobacterium elongatum]SDM58885.1 Uncharacterized membrane protein YfhO [Acetanaerobacterium elongatum]